MTNQQRLLSLIRRHNKEVDDLCRDWERSQGNTNTQPTLPIRRGRHRRAGWAKARHNFNY